MPEKALSPFDFSPYSQRHREFLEAVREFSAGHPFRSASVEELVLENDYFRRPLRPEDFAFLRFERPVEAANVSRLPSLASNRVLLSLYELDSVTPETSSDAVRSAQLEAFSSERNRRFAVQIAPFLEAFAFSYLGRDLPLDELGSPAALASLVERIYATELRFWTHTFSQLTSAEYLQEGLRFILIQRWCLAPTRRRVCAGAVARGVFDGWPGGVQPSLESQLIGDEVFARLGQILGVDRQEHSYWQFYLPTSLARVNLIYALARSPGNTLALVGALYGAQAEWLAFEAAIAQSCPHILTGFEIGRPDPARQLETLRDHTEAAGKFVLQRDGTEGLRLMATGLSLCDRLGERARWDLGEQLKWLSAIDEYCDCAQAISRRIDAECPDIDRETFVEPRDMCSTTHVHDDHRLVVIETGQMSFWGNLGMRLAMEPGDRVLIPAGRLHGSTVLSPECVYHQPIIPDDWIVEMLGTPRASREPHAARRASAAGGVADAGR